MNKYQNGKIYKIISKNTDMIYIGSTIKIKLETRLNQHRYSFKTGIRKMDSCVMFLWDDAEIKLIENYPCESKTELRQREQYWMDQYPDYIVNQRKAISDHKEYNRNYMRKRREEGLVKPISKEYYKEWYQKNRENQLEKKKQRNQDYAAEKAEQDRKYRQSKKGREKRRANDKIKKLCECCNKLISKGNFYTHKKTKVHLENMRKLNSL